MDKKFVIIFLRDIKFYFRFKTTKRDFGKKKYIPVISSKYSSTVNYAFKINSRTFNIEFLNYFIMIEIAALIF